MDAIQLSRASASVRTSKGVTRRARLIVVAYSGLVIAGTGALLIPAATAPGQRTSLADALFTSASSVSITGLATVDTGTHWSLFGQLVVLALMQIGGLGIMTLASLVTVLISGRLALRDRLVAQTETQAMLLP